MTDGELRVTPERLADAAVEFSTASRDVIGLLGMLNATASNLSMELSDRLGSSFDLLWDRVQREIRDLAHAMETIATTLTQAAEAYARAEQQNTTQPTH